MFEFRKVKCHSYLKKIKDGRHLIPKVDSKGAIVSVDYFGEGDDVPDKCECVGEYEFLKTYYKREEMDFEGVLVGTKTIITDGWLFADVAYDPFANDYIYVSKAPNTKIVCGVVYYQNNRKRYVPLVDIEGEEFL